MVGAIRQGFNRGIWFFHLAHRKTCKIADMQMRILRKNKSAKLRKCKSAKNAETRIHKITETGIRKINECRKRSQNRLDQIDKCLTDTRLN